MICALVFTMVSESVTLQAYTHICSSETAQLLECMCRASHYMANHALAQIMATSNAVGKNARGREWYSTKFGSGRRLHRKKLEPAT